MSENRNGKFTFDYNEKVDLKKFDFEKKGKLGRRSQIVGKPQAYATPRRNKRATNTHVCDVLRF